MSGEPEQRQQQATAWLRHGLRLMSGGTPAAAAEALPWFEMALAERLQLPWRGDGRATYDLAACWLNVAEARIQIGGHEHLRAALECLDRGIECLGTQTGDVPPLFRRRLAIAWHNRGLCLQRLGRREDLDHAVRCFDRTIAVLASASAPEDVHCLGCAWMNRANALWRRDGVKAWREVCQSARTALEHLRPQEGPSIVCAEAGLAARHILCQAMVHRLEDVTEEPGSEGLVADLTDALDEGMALCRSWEQRGEVRLRGMAAELFRLGVRVYQRHQPQFLVEFVMENLDPSRSPGALPLPGLYRVAIEAFWRAVRAAASRGIPVRDIAESQEFLATVAEYQAAERRLGALLAASS